MRLNSSRWLQIGLLAVSLPMWGCVGAPADVEDGDNEAAGAAEDEALITAGTPRATLRNTATGRCLQYNGNGDVIAMPCNGTFAQSWLIVRNPNAGLHSMVHLQNSGHCLNHPFIPGDGLRVDAPVCNGTFGTTSSNNRQEWLMPSPSCAKSPNARRFYTLSPNGTPYTLDNIRTPTNQSASNVALDPNVQGCTISGTAHSTADWVVTYQ